MVTPTSSRPTSVTCARRSTNTKHHSSTPSGVWATPSVCPESREPVNLHRRLVAVMAILLVVGLGVADFVTYASVSSFLYGRADDQLSSSAVLAADYLVFAADHKAPATAAELSHRVSPDLYLLVVN